MSEERMTFGWVVKPTTPKSIREKHPDPHAAAEALLAGDRAFIEALPAAFITLWFEDHLQWEDTPTLEAFVAMTYTAALYPRFQIGTIVLGNSYRNPALTAKMAATLQLLTGGRFILGIGAGWKEDEYRAYDYPFPPAGTRIDALDDACRVIKALFTDSPATVAGARHAVTGAYCEPRPKPGIPILIGGGGEKKTLRVVATHADLWNYPFATAEEYAHKQAVLANHCQSVGRDPGAIAHTYYAIVDLSDEQQGARDEGDDMHILQGSPEQVAAELRDFQNLGVRHVMVGFTDFPATRGLERFTAEVLPRL